MAALLFVFVSLANSQPVTQTVQCGGATFPAPLYKSWIDEFRKTHPTAQITYEPIGSEDGIRRFLMSEIECAGTDVMISARELSEVTNPARKLGCPGSIAPPPFVPQRRERDMIQIPTVIGGIAIIYNLPDLGTTLRLSPSVLAGIFEGKINKWNDARIQADNLNAQLPPEGIIRVHRCDGSGTTHIFTQFLNSIDPKNWKAGVGFAIHWPHQHLDDDANGSQGVVKKVSDTKYSIGYVEYLYAVLNQVDYAFVKNKSGHFVRPETNSLSATVNEDTPIPDANVVLDSSDDPAAYPISAFTWLVFPSHLRDDQSRRLLNEFLKWTLNDGQSLTAGYASLPDKVIGRLKDLQILQ